MTAIRSKLNTPDDENGGHDAASRHTASGAPADTDAVQMAITYIAMALRLRLYSRIIGRVHVGETTWTHSMHLESRAGRRRRAHGDGHPERDQEKH